MFERFTTAARDTVLRARHEAQALRHPYIGTEHLLLALLDESAGEAYVVLHEAGVEHDRVAAGIRRLLGPASGTLTEEDAAALSTVGIDLDAVLARIEESFGPGALDAPAPGGRSPRRTGNGTRFTGRAKKVLGLALREAVHLGHRSIGAEHILLGIIREGDGLAARVLVDEGHNLDGLRRTTLAALKRAA